MAVMKAAAAENIGYQLRENEEPHPGDCFIMSLEKEHFKFETAQALGDIAFGLTRFADSTDYSLVEMRLNCPQELEPMLLPALEERQRQGEAAAAIATLFTQKEELFEGLDAPRYKDADEWLSTLTQ